jgi:hypothetical protein
MFSFQRTEWRNRLISLCPLVSDLSELRHLFLASRIWRHDGWVTPVPYFVRRAMLLAEARAIGADTFVETGTFLGDTTWSFRKKFKRIHTIEVEPRFAAMARRRFAGHPAVILHEGDSAKLLGDICAATPTPCLFYLDGHYSGGETGKGEKECPAIEELSAILNRAAGHFRIVIDDARLFGTDPSYPEISRISAFIADQPRRTEMRIENDAIVISLL